MIPTDFHFSSTIEVAWFFPLPCVPSGVFNLKDIDISLPKGKGSIFFTTRFGTETSVYELNLDNDTMTPLP